MSNYSIDEVLEMAVQTEKMGYQFYTGMAERFKNNQGLAKLFTTLATKEKTHEKIFGELKQAAAGKAVEPVQWEEASNYLRAFVESRFFLGNTKSLSGMDYIKSVKDAVRFALGFEKETMLYFWELRKIVAQKEMIDLVIDEERSHIIWLDTFRRELEMAA